MLKPDQEPERTKSEEAQEKVLDAIISLAEEVTRFHKEENLHVGPSHASALAALLSVPAVQTIFLDRETRFRT